MNVRRSGFLLVLSMVACAVDGGDQYPQLWDGPAAGGQRQFVHVTFDTLWTLGGPGDATLASPAFMRVVNGELVLFDRPVSRVLALNPDGQLQWTFGRGGQGPGEFSRDVVDFAEGPGGALIIYDRGNGRITRREPDGAITEIPLEGRVPHATGLAVNGTEFLLIARTDDDPLVTLGDDGEIISQEDLAWPEFAGLPALSRSGSVAQDGDRWLYYPHYGNAWFPYEGSRELGYIGRLVEHQPFPRATVSQRGQTRRTTLVDARCGACTVSIDGDLVYVLHGGKTDDWQALLDTYSWADGVYQFSVRLPRRFQSVLVHEGRVFALYQDPYPTLMALEWELLEK